MRFPVTVKRLIDGQFLVRSAGTVAGELSVSAPTREAALEKARNEIRYRVEWCPCSAVSDTFVELEIDETPPSRWSGSVF